MPRLVLDSPTEELGTITISKSSKDLEKKPRLVLDDTKQSLESLTSEQERAQLEKEYYDKLPGLLKALDIPARPSYAFKALMAEQQRILDERKENPTASTFPGEVRNRKLKAMWRGLTGQERNTMNDLLAKHGVKGIPFLGFGAEIAGDPLMYGGLSAITSGTELAAKKVGEQAMKVPAVRAGIAAVKPYVENVRRLVSTKTTIPHLTSLIDKYMSERHFMKGTEFKYAAATRKSLTSIAKRQRMSPQEVGTRINNIIELRDYPDELAAVVPNISADERTLANSISSHYDSMLVEEMKNGVPISSLSSESSAQISKLRKNLDTIRTAYSKDLTRKRGRIVRELNTYSNALVAERMAKIKGQSASAYTEAMGAHTRAVKALDSQISSIEGKMDALEEARRKAIERLNTDLPSALSLMNKKIAREEMVISGGTGASSSAIGASKRRLNLLEEKKALDLLTSKEGRLQVEDMVRDLDKQLGKLENQFWYLHSELADRLQDIPELAEGSKYIEKMNQIAQQLADDIEINLGPHGKKLAEDIIKLDKKIGKLPQTDIGLPRGESRKLLKALTIERAKKQYGYVPRITTEEAKDMLSSARIGRSKLWTPEIANALNRRTRDFTQEEFNEFAKAHLPGLSGTTIEQFFVTDPAYALAVRGTRSAKAITSAQFLKEVGEVFGVDAKGAPHDYIRLPKHVIDLNPALAGKVFPREVASEVARASDLYVNPAYNPGGWEQIGKSFDAMQNVWKVWNLVMIPKYHFRNVVGNIWNCYLAGIDPTNYPRAAALQYYRKYWNNPKFGEKARQGLRTFGMDIESTNKLIRDMEHMGVVNTGWYAADIDYSINKTLGKQTLADKGQAFGTTLENNARVALYLDSVKKGMSPQESALRVKKFLFDYGDVTPFERNTMKRLFPFYSWVKNNWSLQLEQVWKTPEKFAALAIPLRQRDPSDLLRLKYSFPQLYNSLPIEIQRNVDNVTYIPLEGLIPAADLANIDVGQLVYEQLTPFAKEPIEQYMNKDMYSEQPIVPYTGANKQLWNVEMPARMRHMLLTVVPAARITREIDNIVKKRRDKLPLNAAERSFSLTLGTIYKVDLNELRNRAISNQRKRIKEITNGIRNAAIAGRTEEIEAAKKTLEEQAKIMKELL